MKIQNIQIEVTGKVCEDVRVGAQDICNELILRTYDIEFDSEDQAWFGMNQILNGLLEKTYGPINRKPIDENVSFVPVF